jgi:hypothetical protein
MACRMVRPQSFEFDGVPMRVAMLDELGRIDLNQAEPALLVNLLQVGRTRFPSG